MGNEKSKKSRDTFTVRNDSMTTNHLLHHLTTSHLRAALKPTEKPKPVSPAAEKSSVPTSEPKEK